MVCHSLAVTHKFLLRGLVGIMVSCPLSSSNALRCCAGCVLGCCLPTVQLITICICSDKFMHCPTLSTERFTLLTSSLVINFLRSAGVAAADVAARSSSTAWRNWFWRWASCGLEAHSRAASTMRAVASARVFAAARRRRCISESGCFSASPCKHHSMLHSFIFFNKWDHNG